MSDLVSVSHGDKYSVNPSLYFVYTGKRLVDLEWEYTRFNKLVIFLRQTDV